jgi:hypothetical protein
MKTLHFTPQVYFCNNAAAATETLFQPINGRTASGTFKKLKNQVRFFDLSGKLFAALVKNRHNETLLVSAADTDNGVLYSFALSNSDKKRLGLSEFSYSQEKEFEEKLWETAAAF